jgi:hypothetical protein
MNYLREMMKDYKNEVKEILAADKTLATEIQVQYQISQTLRFIFNILENHLLTK